ncbi:AAA family ATPase [Nocardia abscessus]|uniref:AAA family ATPase n=1 Tax=Nocardia abscessus TaxID=120957 RepID=UPI002456D9FD|nr:AAA family ATPase [Nocardia abscessus]
MTTRFRLDLVRLDTTEGAVEYRFRSDLTVLAGPTGVGKTTLLELIKFGFGVDATLAPVAVKHIDSVTLHVRIGDAQLQLVRSLDRAKRRTVRVTDLITQDRMPDHSAGLDAEYSLNSLLMKSLGLRDDLRASSEKGKKPGNRVTFADILAYVYVPQRQINRDIAYSQDNFRNLKRRTVFELLYGLTDAEILDWRANSNALAHEIAVAEARHTAVVDFLQESGTGQRDEAENRLHLAEANQAAAERQLAQLRDELDPVRDSTTRTLRDLLSNAERSFAGLTAGIVDIDRRQSLLAAERRRVEADMDRLGRMRRANLVLADIEFRACPRCMQSLENREIPANACRVCLQPDPVNDSTSDDQYETRQLKDQIQEMSEQIVALSSQRAVVERTAAEKNRLIDLLNAQIEERTAERISPRLQAFSDAAQALASARSEQQRWEAVLRQWDVVADLHLHVRTLTSQRAQLELDIQHAQQALDERRTEIINELSEEFAATVRAIGIPGVNSATIDPNKYLPVINGNVFSESNQLAGGLTTATQIAYWCSLVAVALRTPDNLYPLLLLIDSPRMALNTATGLSKAMYRRLTTLVGTLPGRLQVIIADNELPKAYRASYAQIDFDYDTPTVSTITHPGPNAVETIEEGT